jgi:hypothetical protein
MILARPLVPTIEVERTPQYLRVFWQCRALSAHFGTGRVIELMDPRGKSNLKFGKTKAVSLISVILNLKAQKTVFFVKILFYTEESSFLIFSFEMLIKINRISKRLISKKKIHLRLQLIYFTVKKRKQNDSI